MACTTQTFQKLFARLVMSTTNTNKDKDKTPEVPAPNPKPRSRSFPFRRQSPPAVIFHPWKNGDNYDDIKELTHGSEARTSLTKSHSTGRIFVVKRFKTYFRYPDRSSSQSDTQPLPNEALLLLNVLRPHPNILEAFGCDLLGGLKANLYTEYCAGGDLLEQVLHFIELEVFTPEIFALHVFISLSNALAYLHYGLRWDPQVKQYWSDPGHVAVVHGDIKCENVFLRWSSKPERAGFPDVVLGDFGGSQVANNFRGYGGTDGYQAPEVAAIHALKESDPQAHRAALRKTGIMTMAADVFSLGETMHMLIRGRLHVTGADPYTRPVKTVRDDERRKSIGVDFTRRGKPAYLTNGITEAVQWCLRPNPATRPKMREGSFFGVLRGFRRSLEVVLRCGEKMPGAMWASLPGENAAVQQ